jgi:hypothetical protein
MSSTPATDISQAITERGFWAQQDATLGEAVDAIVQTGFQLKSEPGMRLCQVAFLQKEVGSESLLPPARAGRG